MIKFVYFDVGGVAIKDFSGTDKWAVLKNEIGITHETNQKFEDLYSKYEPQINTTLHINDFYKIVQKEFNLKPLPNFDFLIDGFIKRFNKNDSLWPVMETIKKDCKIGLLTNMWVDMLEEINNYNLLPKIEWDKVVDSTKIGMQKPNKDIFEYATKLAEVGPKEIFFIDNSQKNIDAAKNYGWQTFLYNPLDTDKSSEDLLIFYRSLR